MFLFEQGTADKDPVILMTYTRHRQKKLQMTIINLSIKKNFTNLSEKLSPKTYALLYCTKPRPTYICTGAQIPDASSKILRTGQPHIMDSQYGTCFSVTLVAPEINGWLLDLWEICSSSDTLNCKSIDPF